MKWDVRGAWKADGGDAQMTVDAPNQQAAEHLATTRGIMVETCWPAAAPPVMPHLPSAPAPAPVVQVVMQEAGPSSGVAAVLSFFVPGAGQIYKGQVINGIVWLIAVVIGYFCLIIPGLVLHLLCILGAASGGKRR